MRQLLVLAVIAGLSSRAAADPAAAFAAGMSAYNKGEYATAIVAFEAVFREDPRAEVAFTLAQAHRNQYFADHDVTHLHRALGLYRHYLAEAPTGRRAAHARMHLETIETILASLSKAEAAPGAPPPTQLLVSAEMPDAQAAVDDGAFGPIPRVVEVTPGKHRVRVQAVGYDPAELDALAVAERLVVVPATLRAQQAQLHVNTENGAEIAIDNVPASPATKLAAGPHRITVMRRGRRAVAREIDVAPGAHETVTIDLVVTAQRRASRWTFIAAGGLAAVSLVAVGGAWFAQRDAEAIYARRMTAQDIEDYNSALDRRNASRGVAIGFGATAGLAALTGAALWYFDMPRTPDRVPTIAPVLGPESVGAAVSGRF